MTATLATLRARVQVLLSDSGATAYTTTAIDEAIRQAMNDYSEIWPRQLDTVLTLPAAGREIALNSLADLTNVTAVYWPYDSLAEAWPPNLVTGFSLTFDDGQPLLTLTSKTGAQPQADDELRLWYTTPQTLDGLDGAAGTSVNITHESWIALGAAGYAALLRAGDVSATYTESAQTQANLEQWGAMCLAQFRAKLAQLSLTATQRGQPFGAGWKLDDYDTGHWQGA